MLDPLDELRVVSLHLIQLLAGVALRWMVRRWLILLQMGDLVPFV